MNTDKTLKELTLYKHLHEINKHGNYSNRTVTVSAKNTELAQRLNNSYDKMDSDEMRALVVKTMTDNEVRSRLLKFEFEHLAFTKPTSRLTISAFKTQVQKMFTKYQGKAGGFLIEDVVWEVTNGDSDNEFYFNNSVCAANLESMDTQTFLCIMVERIKRLSTGVLVDISFVQDKEEKLAWILIKCTFDKN